MIHTMSEFNQSLLIANIYRYLLIVVGGCFGYWGYRLFDKGYFEKGGELKAQFGGQHLFLKQVGPGVFFAFIGVLAISIGVFREINISVPSSSGASVGRMSFPFKDDPCDKTSEPWHEGLEKPHLQDRTTDKRPGQ